MELKLGGVGENGTRAMMVEKKRRKGSTGAKISLLEEDDDDDYNPVAGIDDNDNDTDDILDGSYHVEAEEVVRDKIRKRTGGEGGREKTQSIEKTDEKRGIVK